ncbi:hypothetical protein GCM10010994_46120 [Chelatococcus reniformis]|uniref:Uncharacterized protein n=1 Tax=Chelatococcus reniformis TaxID=1494448 RepID=A0A916URA5_9HYPH|nr:hypothetical protein GCM10010994_46120 [Chelatococcus reniformis]
MRRLEMTSEVDARTVDEMKVVFVAPNYFSPLDVVRDPSLSAAEKRAILADWASDARALPNLPTYRQLDNGALLQVRDIMEALNALDCGNEPMPSPSWPARRMPGAARARWLQRLLRRGGRGDDDDDDPPPVPARMRRPRPSGPSAEAVSLCAA